MWSNKAKINKRNTVKLPLKLSIPEDAVRTAEWTLSEIKTNRLTLYKEITVLLDSPYTGKNIIWPKIEFCVSALMEYMVTAVH
jgi:hypothetical protein